MERAGGCGGGEQRPHAGGGCGRLLRLSASWPLPRLSDTRGGREHPREKRHNREGKGSSVKPSAGLRGPPCSAPCHPACLQLPAPSPRGCRSCQAGSVAQNGELLCCRVGPGSSSELPAVLGPSAGDVQRRLCLKARGLINARDKKKYLALLGVTSTCLSITNGCCVTTSLWQDCMNCVPRAGATDFFS